MNFDTIFFMDAIIVLFSIYIVAVALRMKKTGVIDKLFLNAEDIKKIKNKKGFIDFIFPRSLIFAGIAFVEGAVGIISDKVIKIPYWNYIEMVSFMAVVIVLSNQIRKGKDKF